MLIRAGYEIEVASERPVPFILALSTHSSMKDRIIGEDRVRVDGQDPLPTFVDVFGNRKTRLLAPAGETVLWSDFIVETSRDPDPQHPEAGQHPIADLPDDTLLYLMPSRYCDSDRLMSEAWSRFGEVAPGWARVQAITEFVHNHVHFDYAHGRPDKTAGNAFDEGNGVCRDFAHLSIALCRAMNIPARYASGYLGDIDWPYSGPGDFCAWFEVFLDGAWHTFDARYNTPRIGRVVMVRGYDAAQVAMMTSFGAYTLNSFRVWCDELDPGLSDNAARDLLQTRPDAEALVTKKVA